MSTYQKLPIEFKTNWLAALRSGQIEQASSVLRARDKDGKRCQCCLGVACDVLNLEWEPNEDGEYYFIHGTNNEDMPTEDMFPRDVWNVLAQQVSETSKQNILAFLAVENDGNFDNKPKTFNEIALWIDSNL